MCDLQTWCVLISPRLRWHQTTKSNIFQTRQTEDKMCSYWFISTACSSHLRSYTSQCVNFHTDSKFCKNNLYTLLMKTRMYVTRQNSLPKKLQDSCKWSLVFPHLSFSSNKTWRSSLPRDTSPKPKRSPSHCRVWKWSPHCSEPDKKDNESDSPELFKRRTTIGLRLIFSLCKFRSCII